MEGRLGRIRRVGCWAEVCRGGRLPRCYGTNPSQRRCASPRLSPVERNRRRCEALDGLLRIRRTANLVCGGQVDLYGFGIMLWEMYTVRFHFARHCSLCTGP